MKATAAGTFEDIAAWVIDNIQYCTDMEQYGCVQYWASPAETLASGRGDCDDRAILFAHLVNEGSGLKGYFIMSEDPADSRNAHVTVAFTEVPGRLFLTGEKQMDWRVMQVCDFDTMMRIVEANRGRNPYLLPFIPDPIRLREMSVDWMLEKAALNV